MKLLFSSTSQISHGKGPEWSDMHEIKAVKARWYSRFPSLNDIIGHRKNDGSRGPGICLHLHWMNVEYSTILRQID